MKTKITPMTGLKAGPADGLGDGEFIAYASTWTTTPDAYGDVVKQGAFAQTIKDWKASGNVVPVLYGHRSDDPSMNVGATLDLAEDDHGLKVHGKFDDTPTAQQVYSLVKGRRLNQLSFAYDTITSGPVKAGGGPKPTSFRRSASTKSRWSRSEPTKTPASSRSRAHPAVQPPRPWHYASPSSAQRASHHSTSDIRCRC
ncbi:HK97 family phage prohead protease [Leifsonia poae]|uniref:HK97 family phage prohead protease n=1 Tax=Leifsonia poae TaxID=110933 RepID=UPI003D6719EA